MNRRAEVPMDEMVQVRVLSKEKALIVRAARRSGMTLSDFVRVAAFRAASYERAA